MAQSSVIRREQFSPNCDNAVTGGEVCASSQPVNENIRLTDELKDDDDKLDARCKNTDPGAVTESDIEKENFDLNFDTAKRTLEQDAKSRTLPVPKQRQPRQKPGVILLGRGNSFSLGRSEVIVLHHRPKAATRTKFSKQRGIVSGKDGKLVTISERQVSVENDNVVRLNVTGESGRVESDDYPTIPSPSPPPVSNGLYHPDSQQTGLRRDSGDDDDDREEDDHLSSRVLDLVPSYEDDLQDLWHKAESVMALRKDKVKTILEEFGIGEPGGGGGEDENYWEDEDVEGRKKEEEEVWCIVQENFRV